LKDTIDRDIDRPTFDAQTGRYVQTYDATDGREIVTTAILSVAAVADVPATDMAPLHEHVDTDAVADAIEAIEEDRYPAAETELRIHGHDVAIGRGRILIDPPEGGGSAERAEERDR
jgi:hypothetical protein